MNSTDGTRPGREFPEGEALEREFRAPLTRYARRYLDSQDDAEDVVQETFIRLLAASVVPENLRAWLYRAARNVCLNRLRDSAHRAHQSLPTGFSFPVEQTGLLTNLVRAEGHADLLLSLERLSDSQREVLYLRYFEELSREEIAEVIAESVSVVKSRLYEGVARLRELSDPPA